MFSYDFTFQSLTAAQSGRNVLHSQRIPAKLLRAPASISAQGCAYVLQVEGRYGALASSMLRYYAGGYGRVYRVYPDGRTEEAVL